MQIISAPRSYDQAKDALKSIARSNGLEVRACRTLSKTDILPHLKALPGVLWSMLLADTTTEQVQAAFAGKRLAHCVQSATSVVVVIEEPA